MNDIIKEKSKKIKSKINDNAKNTWFFINSPTGFFIILLIFVSTLSFFLGKLSVIHQIRNNQTQKIRIIKSQQKNNIEIVASKNGKVFHFPWCSGAQTIKEENKIYFKNKEEAIKKGYRLAKNCEDIK